MTQPSLTGCIVTCQAGRYPRCGLSIWNDVHILVTAYKEWISRLRDSLGSGLSSIPNDLHETAYGLIERCENCLVRMTRGIEYLNKDKKKSKLALKAFQLANHAMFIAQLRASRETREPIDDNGKLGWKTGFSDPDPKQSHDHKGYWRPFQIAFVIMSVLGICEPVEEPEEREMVDLIWFPTGGGKTEAYLGLTTFTIFFKRIAGLEPGGTDVLMRYTLRLLTAQQFQRATLLFCAMEHIRKQPEFSGMLGSKRFTLGMYVGGDSTPNTRIQAVQALKKLNRDTNSENPFILLKCPWCNAKLGPLKKPINKRKVLGYYEGSFAKDMPNSVVYKCPDTKCEFGFRPLSPKDPLPVILIDEDIFDNPPNLVIGTVDKFAMISWKPEVRSIFGINKDGTHSGIPPSLIIHDELHLISGPLGSMVGAYETVFESLCSNGLFKPKIVASTATISRAKEQVSSLYARDGIMLFPPSGLEADDSFFARKAEDENGKPEPGRLYVGVMAPAHGSFLTTQARIYAAILQYAALIEIPDGDKSVRDPWWTLLIFFNSLRELGGAATLLVSDARDYLRVILGRHGIPYSEIRQLLTFEELTSRIRNDKIPEGIQKLEKPYDTDEKGYLVKKFETSGNI